MKVEEFKEITYEKEASGLVTVTINIPKRKNAMSPYTFYELFWAVDAFENDSECGVMILTGAKDPDSSDPEKEAFSSGGYFNAAALENIPEEIRADIDLADIAQKRISMKMFKCMKPIIAAINGLSVGAGFTLPLVGADLIYMSEYAWIRLPFSSLGIISELASSFLLPRLMGFQKAKEIVYFGRTVTAREAVELGLANEVVPHEKLMEVARERALALTPPRGPGFSIQAMKKCIHQPYIEAVSRALDLENEGLNECFKTADFAEALTARMEKREPLFRGE